MFDMLFFVCLIQLFSLNKDGDVDLNASPQALDKLLGYELAFKIKVQPKFRNSVVLKCSDDSSLINAVMDMLADAEVMFNASYLTLNIVKSMYSIHIYLFSMGRISRFRITFKLLRIWVKLNIIENIELG